MLCTGPNALWNLLCSPSETCLQWLSNDGVYLHTRSDGHLFNITHLPSKMKIREITIRGLLFADDAAIASHTQVELQRLTDNNFL